MTDGITISAAAVSAIVGAVCTYLKMKSAQKVKVENQPLEVEAHRVGPYVTTGECKQHRCAMGKRLDSFEVGFSKIFDKLDENDTRSEQRSTALHARIDPLIAKVAANNEAVDILKSQLKEKRQ